MTDATNATPRPWSVTGYEQHLHIGGTGSMMVLASMNQHHKDTPANAAFLIAAVNGYESALARIKTLVTVLAPDLLELAADACDRAATSEMREVAAELRAKAKHERAALSTTDASPQVNVVRCTYCGVMREAVVARCGACGQPQPDPRDERIKALETAATHAIVKAGMIRAAFAFRPETASVWCGELQQDLRAALVSGAP